MSAADGAGGVAASGGFHCGDPAQGVFGLDTHMDSRCEGTGGVSEVEGSRHLDVKVETSPGSLNGVVVFYPPISWRLSQLASRAIPPLVVVGEDGATVGA